MEFPVRGDRLNRYSEGDDDLFERYLDELTSHPPMSREEERKVARRARNGDKEAQDRLITANLRFVISYVKKYRGWGLSLQELVAAGNEGLVIAAQKFDPERDVKFISYAVWWVKARVRAALTEQVCPVKIPVSRNTLLVALPRTEAELQKQLGRRPSDDEVAQELDVKPELISQMRGLVAPATRLDSPLSNEDDDDRTHYEMLDLEPSDQDTSKVAEASSRQRFVRDALQSELTSRERKIVVLYYGLDGLEALTLGEIGSLLGVTRERIRQLRNRALEKLREGPEGDALKKIWKLSA